MRAFPSMEERDRLLDTFYDGPDWLEQIEPSVMPMIALYEAEPVEPKPGFEGFDGNKAL